MTSNIFNSMVATQAFKFNIPFESIGLGSLITNQELALPIPNALLYLAGASCALHLYRRMRRMAHCCLTYCKSWFNAKKYLQPIADKIPEDARLLTDNGSKPRSYAVIYGASNKAGKSYSYYLSM